jgi:high-affinity Fe2+/Pb2+ permease
MMVMILAMLLMMMVCMMMLMMMLMMIHDVDHNDACRENDGDGDDHKDGNH